jgi:microcystin-dependent protein
VPVGQDNPSGGAGTAGTITVAGGNFDGTVFANTGGAQNETLTAAQLPAHSHPITDVTHNHTINIGTSVSNGPPALGAGNTTGTQTTSSTLTGINTTQNNIGGGASHPQIPPSIVLNYAIRAT